jgi:hypothetical protein
MAVSDKHTFKVWHPYNGLPAKFEDKEFEFMGPVSRTFARNSVQKQLGYAIAAEGKKRGPKVTTQRRSKKK